MNDFCPARAFCLSDTCEGLLVKRGASMMENSSGNGRVVECTECGPPRQFKDKAGLNGHIQLKHGRLPDSRDVLPNGDQSRLNGPL